MNTLVTLNEEHESWSMILFLEVLLMNIFELTLYVHVYALEIILGHYAL